jgi:hypothetical protein
MLARSATAGQATFEPDEEDDDDEEEDEEEPEPEPEDELETVSFLSLLPGLSPEAPEDLSPEALSFEPEEEPELSDFLPSEPFADAVAGSELFWAARLSVR